MKNNVELTDQQQSALAGMLDFIDDPTAQMMALKGYAGTGKTFLMGALLPLLGDRTVHVTAPTHKATKVLSEKTGRECQTIHSLLGLKPELDTGSGRMRLQRQRRPDVSYGAVLIVDECSMIGEDLFGHIRSAVLQKYLKVIFVGDPAQLPPVGEIASQSFDQHVIVELTDIVRQVAGNPVIGLSVALREAQQGAAVPPIAADGLIEVLPYAEFERRFVAAQVAEQGARLVCWTNKRTIYYNQLVRVARHGDAARQAMMQGELLLAVEAYAPPGDDRDVLIQNDAEVLVEQLTIGPDQHGVDCYHLIVIADGDEVSCRTPTPAGRGRYAQVAKELRAEADQLQRAKRHAELTRQSYSDKQNKARAAAWRAFFDFRADYARFRPPYALTVHKSQGSTYADGVFVDLDDIGRNTKRRELLQLVYVAVTRTGSRAVLAGRLPDRLYEQSEAVAAAAAVGVAA